MGNEKLGIESLWAVLRFGLNGGELGVALANGVDLADWKPIVQTSKDVVAMAKGLKDAWPEAKDLDDSEREELARRIEAEFDIPNDKIELAIEKGLIAALALTELTEVISK